MCDTPGKFEERLHQLLKRIAEPGVHSAARGLSELVGAEMQVSEPSVCLVPLADIQDIVDGPENEVVGIYDG